MRPAARSPRSHFIDLIIDYNSGRATTERIADNIDNKLNNDDNVSEEIRGIGVISRKRCRRIKALLREYANFLESRCTCFKLEKNIIKSH